MLELCGSIDMDIFKRDAPAAEDSFLLQSIFALSALYLADAEARSDSCFASSRNLMGRYRSKAQASSRLLSDEPSGTTAPTQYCFQILFFFVCVCVFRC